MELWKVEEWQDLYERRMGKEMFINLFVLSLGLATSFRTLSTLLFSTWKNIQS